MMMKVTQYKTGKASLYAQGERRRRQSRRMAPQLLTAGKQQRSSSSAAHLRGAAAGRRVFGCTHAAGLAWSEPLAGGSMPQQCRACSQQRSTGCWQLMCGLRPRDHPKLAQHGSLCLNGLLRSSCSQERGVTTVSSPATVARPSLCSIKRQAHAVGLVGHAWHYSGMSWVSRPGLRGVVACTKAALLWITLPGPGGTDWPHANIASQM